MEPGPHLGAGAVMSPMLGRRRGATRRGAAWRSAGPFGSYAGFSELSKVMLSILMLLRRVEIVPVAVLFTRSYWRP